MLSLLSPLTARSARALLSPSARVLAAAAERDCGVAHARELPWSDVHWPTLIALTSFERAESQVFRLVRAAPDGAVPEDAMAALQRLYRVAAFRSAELSDAAGVACDVLQRNGIRALWLKGAALAMQSADEFSLRSMGDLDVLVAPGEHSAARAALAAAGWHGAADQSYAAHHHDAPLFWRAGIRLELHSGLIPPGHPFADGSAEDWIGRGVSRQWGTRTVTVLPGFWHLVHTSVHWAWSHEGAIGTWQYLHDLLWLTRDWAADSPEWTELSWAAADIGAQRPVGWGLWTGSRLCDARIDEAVVEQLRGGTRGLAGVAERAWVLRALHTPMASPSVAWSRYWWRKAMRGLGDADEAWPWTAGRTAISAEPGEMETVPRQGTSVAQWRRHLGRVLRG
jgi:Uncharacterised nucleotidyltransferase